MTAISLSALRELLPDSHDDPPDDGGGLCAKCGDPFECAVGLDPTPLCNLCAQEVATHFLDAAPALLACVTALQELVAIRDSAAPAPPADALDAARLDALVERIKALADCSYWATAGWDIPGDATQVIGRLAVQAADAITALRAQVADLREQLAERSSNG